MVFLTACCLCQCADRADSAQRTSSTQFGWVRVQTVVGTCKVYLCAGSVVIDVVLGSAHSVDTVPRSRRLLQCLTESLSPLSIHLHALPQDCKYCGVCPVYSRSDLLSSSALLTGLGRRCLFHHERLDASAFLDMQEGERSAK